MSVKLSKIDGGGLGRNFPDDFCLDVWVFWVVISLPVSSGATFSEVTNPDKILPEKIWPAFPPVFGGSAGAGPEPAGESVETVGFGIFGADGMA